MTPSITFRVSKLVKHTNVSVGVANPERHKVAWSVELQLLLCKTAKAVLLQINCLKLDEVYDPDRHRYADM
jgi:hypothetical protein